MLKVGILGTFVWMLGCGANRPTDPPVTNVTIVARNDLDLDAGAQAPVVEDAGPANVVARDTVDLRGNSAASPFARYLNRMHLRIHPIFTDEFLVMLEKATTPGPMSDPKIYTILEIVLSSDGSVRKVGVVKTSGVTAFDAGAIDSVMTAAPFGRTPAEIRSPDGNVYMHWEFHRDTHLACSTVNVRPILLRSAP